MKRYLLYIILLSPYCLQAQVENFISKDEIGGGAKCISKIIPRGQDEDSTQFIIKITRATFVADTIQINYNDISNYNIKNNSLEVVVKPGYSDYYRKESYENCLYKNEGICFSLFHFQDKIQKIPLDSLAKRDYIITIHTLTTESKIEKIFVDHEPDSIVKNEYYFPLAVWNDNINLACCYITFPEDDITKIQHALRDNGYKLSITGKLDSKTKAAITRFQIKHDLEIGALNQATLKALEIKGVEYYSHPKPYPE